MKKWFLIGYIIFLCIFIIGWATDAYIWVAYNYEKEIRIICILIFFIFFIFLPPIIISLLGIVESIKRIKNIKWNKYLEKFLNIIFCYILPIMLVFLFPIACIGYYFLLGLIYLSFVT